MPARLPAGAPLVVSHQRLAAFVRSVLERWGAPAAIATPTSELIVRTDLRGVDSHGVGMLPSYQRWCRAGFIVPDAEPAVVRDEGPLGVLDGGQGLGHYVGTVAMRLALVKARAHGVGLVAVHNSNHYGAAANYSMMALAQDMIGLAMTNGPWPAVVPTFGRQAMFGTNPISLAAPTDREYPFVLDMATSTVAIGTFAVAARWGRPIPAGWALDSRGHPTTDAAEALDARQLTPLGGTPEGRSWKGYGLGVMVDVLCGVLAGACFGELSRAARAEPTRANVGHFFGAIDVARFRPVSEFKADLDDLLRSLKESPKAENANRIWVAGEPEWECEQRRRREGIPLAPGLVPQLRTLAAELRIPFTLDQT